MLWWTGEATARCTHGHSRTQTTGTFFAPQFRTPWTVTAIGWWHHTHAVETFFPSSVCRQGITCSITRVSSTRLSPCWDSHCTNVIAIARMHTIAGGTWLPLQSCGLLLHDCKRLLSAGSRLSNCHTFQIRLRDPRCLAIGMSFPEQQDSSWQCGNLPFKLLS